ncbi:unnamed protein product [Penicillium nalgiovense]|nr:unnamed protein product [Penicillium nalgiovense]
MEARRHITQQRDRPIQRLPLGLYLRKALPHGAPQYPAEAHAFGMVEKFTQIPAPKGDTRAAKSHAVSHAIVFTHGDLNPRNILAENGKITGIVDWENAGFFPEYWEYTKMHYTIRHVIRWLADVVDQVFEDYRDELHVENMLSDLASPF